MTLPPSPMGCPMDALLRLLMGPWTSYILWVLRNNGPTRFGDLKRRVAGISAKVLAERLRVLEDAGVVYRNYEPTIPPQVTYGLTERGGELESVLDAIDTIAKRWNTQDGKTMPDCPRNTPPANATTLPAESPEKKKKARVKSASA
ncbi:MAG TPA: helix-turn-helix domain-containing protein [Gammaproteobacteria bacterium]|nr:helix-turn-helix domain-containing protein [Gammaproteobacteria bacterium]